MKVTLLALLALMATGPAMVRESNRFACLSNDNPELCALYKSDQLPRMSAGVPRIDDRSEAAALLRAHAIVASGELTSANDYFRVATLFLHSHEPRDYLLSHLVATEGISKFPDHPRIRLLSALSIDRYLLSIGQPQVFGTQLEGLAQEHKFRQPLDCSLVTKRTRLRFIADYPEPCSMRK